MATPASAVLSQARPEPIPIFQAVQIQTHTRCNFRCKFCPHGKLPLQHGDMSEDMFSLVVSRLAEIHFAGTVFPYLMNEPLLDERLPQRVGAIRSACPQARIWIDTNGSLADENLLCELVRSGADVVNMEIYLPRGKRLPEKFVAMHRALPDDVRRNVFLYERDGEAVLTNRAGNLPDRPIPKRPYRLPCERPFHQIYIAFDGNLVLCCQDWRRETALGNVREEGLDSIWRGAACEEVRTKLMACDRSMPLCSRCDYAGRPGALSKRFRAGLPPLTRVCWRGAAAAETLRDVFGNRMFFKYARSWCRRRLGGVKRWGAAQK